MKAKRGRFELADGGTVFLDEVANASSGVQKKLLRLVQEKTFERLGSETSIQTDVRIIAASNEDFGHVGQRGYFQARPFLPAQCCPHQTPPVARAS